MESWNLVAHSKDDVIIEMSGVIAVFEVPG